MSKRNSAIPSTKKPTLRDVGRLANVDPSLVSRVINNDPKAFATEETRARILNAVNILNYKPNVSARGLKLAHTSMLGLLMPDLGNPINASIVQGVQERALELGYGVIIGNHAAIGADKTYVSRFLQGQVDGLIAFGHAMTDASLEAIHERDDGRILAVNGRIPGISSSVTVQDGLATEYCVEHLVKLGHKNIVGIFTPIKFDTAKRRLDGFMKACKKEKINPIIVEAQGYSYKDGYESTLQAIDHYAPTAIFASSTQLAIGALAAARKRKQIVPDRISVITLYDSDISNFTSPPLTTVTLPALEMGMEAVERLVGMIRTGKSNHYVLTQKPVLKIRESTAPFIKYADN